MRTSAAGLPIVQVYVSGTMIDRLGQLPVKGERELGRKGERAAVIREAVTAWLCHTAALSLRELGGTIRGAMRQKRLSPRPRLLHRWTKKTERRLLDLVYDVSPWLLRPVPPIALAHVTLVFCIDTAEGRPPDVLAQEIGPALVKRGRTRREIIEESDLK
jgi:hypothetical protein